MVLKEHSSESQATGLRCGELCRWATCCRGVRKPQEEAISGLLEDFAQSHSSCGSIFAVEKTPGPRDMGWAWLTDQKFSVELWRVWRLQLLSWILVRRLAKEDML